MEQIIIRLVNLPHDVHGFTAVDADGNYNVYLNSRGDLETAFIHELDHILNNDFYNAEDIYVVEKIARHT